MSDQIAVPSLPLVEGAQDDTHLVVKQDGAVRRVASPFAALASIDPAKGSDMLAARFERGGHYLQHVSHAINEGEHSLLRCIKPSERRAIREGTSTYDATADLQRAFNDTEVTAFRMPYGLIRYAGNITRNNGKSLAIRGVSRDQSILRCVGAGGIVFDGGAIDQQSDAFAGVNLSLADLRIEAAINNAGTAVRMIYTGGEGYPTPGPSWRDVVIGATGINTGFNKGIHGTNVRDMRLQSCDIFGSFQGGYPAVYTMDHAALFDGEDHGVELRFLDLYAYYCKQVIEVGGQYEGIYLNDVTTVGVHHVLKWHTTTPNPVLHAFNSYLAAERSCIDINKVSYWQLANNCFNSTAPVPDADFTALIVRDALGGGQTMMGSCTNNTFVGTNYYARSGGTYSETAVNIVGATLNHFDFNQIYDMRVGFTGSQVSGAGTLNRIGGNNRFHAVTTEDSVPRVMKTGNHDPEVYIRASRTTNQTVSLNTDTTVVFNNEESDARGYYNPATGEATLFYGLHEITAKVRISDPQANESYVLQIFVNGAAVDQNSVVASTNTQHLFVSVSARYFVPQDAVVKAVLYIASAGGGTRTIVANASSNVFTITAVGA